MYATLFFLFFLILLTLVSVKKNESTFMDRQSTDTIRGICILGIALHHTYKLGFLLGAFGALGTGIFFSLSGYGNYLSLEKSGGASWLNKRLKRVIVPFVLVWILYTIALLLTSVC